MRKSDLEKVMLDVFREMRKDAYIDTDTKLKADLNIDSLELFSACIEIEERTKMEVCKYISGDIITIKDLLNAVTYKKTKFDIDYSEYPKKKDMKKVMRLVRFLNKFYEIKVSGIECISSEKQIICPNHESNYDPLIVVTALVNNNISIDDFCCFASEDVWESWHLRSAFTTLGAIPLFRTENSSLALKRAEEILKKDDHTKLLIHPEGKRTRDGRLGLFKNGAAMLSEDTRTEIIPVCINGTYEVYPYGRSIPKFLGHHIIEVKFLEPVSDGDIIKVREAIRKEKELYYKNK